MYYFTTHLSSNFFKPLAVFLSVALLMTACTSTPKKNKAHQDWHPGVSVKNGIPNRYQVKAGDSISQIAYRYGLDWRELSRINRLDANHTIYIGQWLILWESAQAYHIQSSAPVIKAPAVANHTSQPQPTPSPQVRTETTKPAAVVQPQPRPVQSPTQSNPIVATPTSRVAGFFVMPVANARLYRRFGEQGDGVWFSAPARTRVVAVESGVISYPKKGDNTQPLAIVIHHDNDYTSTYMHLQEVYAFEGQTVKAGEVIGTVGAQNLLEFHLLQKGRAIDPMPLLR